ncbi:hypothetical protein EUGRSUZ_A00722 [Eucalyptus grandis]|uniref:Uncharacterized protein n=2 Tax=Eucalyptus grandis TaxID=71139 RepID=A0ACC3M1S6_EUCGR|nr:hypothetical protein EUGRSUZ_A00722 [Eucalyptus grandis]
MIKNHMGVTCQARVELYPIPHSKNKVTSDYPYTKHNLNLSVKILSPREREEESTKYKSKSCYLHPRAQLH